MGNGIELKHMLQSKWYKGIKPKLPFIGTK